jgi:hypothetical protein
MVSKKRFDTTIYEFPREAAFTRGMGRSGGFIAPPLRTKKEVEKARMEKQKEKEWKNSDEYRRIKERADRAARRHHVEFNARLRNERMQKERAARNEEKLKQRAARMKRPKSATKKKRKAHKKGARAHHRRTGAGDLSSAISSLREL